MSIEDQIKKSIAESGLAVMTIAPSEDEPPFSYSVGLSLNYGTEVFVEGLQQGLSNYLITTLATAISNANLALEPGIYVGLVQNRMPIALVEADDQWKSVRTLLVNNVLGDDYRLLQMLIPDKDYKFPWDDEYDTSMGEQKIRSKDASSPDYAYRCSQMPIHDVTKALGQSPDNTH